MVKSSSSAPYCFVSGQTEKSKAASSSKYVLTIRQQPQRAKVCGLKERDRRPIDPPPIVQIKLADPSSDRNKDYLQSPYLFMCCNLVHADDISGEIVAPAHRALAGTVVSSLNRLKDVDNSDGGFFVFGDMSVRIEGRFCLRFTLFELIEGQVVHVMTSTSNPLTVYSGKMFPGMSESTFLSRSFSDQGVRIRIRKDHHVKPKKPLPSDTVDDSSMHSPPSSCHEAEHSDNESDMQPCFKRPRPSTHSYCGDSAYASPVSRHVAIAARPTPMHSRHSPSEPMDRTPPSSPGSLASMDSQSSRHYRTSYASEEASRRPDGHSVSRQHPYYDRLHLCITMRFHHLLSVLPLILSAQYVYADGPQTTQQFLDQATAFLGKGEYNLALQSYDAAIDRDPSNYLSYFKRAATHLTLGRNNQALADFTTILRLKPDFGQALLQRGKIYTKAGDFVKAKQDLELYYANHQGSDPQGAEEVAALLSNIDEAAQALALAEAAMQAGQTDECIRILGSAILTAPVYVPFRLQRAECHVARGEVEEAVNDLNRATHNAATNAELMHRLSTMSYYSLYMPEQALAQIKKCISFDPENKLCKGLFRKLKTTEKDIVKLDSDLQNGRWAGVINKSVAGEKALVKTVETETNTMEEVNKAVGKMPKRLLLKIYAAACKAYTENKDAKNALKWCSSTLSLDESNVDGLVGKGMAHMLNDDFEEAIRDFTKAQELAGGQDHNIHEKLSRAQRLLKQSQQKDYYKILGIARSATPRDIKKAFRKQALQWHPDTYRGELNAEQVEKKMASLNEAYEVLSNPELRERFDNGDDPNDPQGQQNPFSQGFAGHPFFFQQGGGSPFQQQSGGGGFQFNFQF
ncbi:hypothetical protein BGZ67_004744 [Mortierella alpina]|nr:hypothetical protein BGZ67_004744 [Mortierella alpina]